MVLLLWYCRVNYLLQLSVLWYSSSMLTLMNLNPLRTLCQQQFKLFWTSTNTCSNHQLPCLLGTRVITPFHCCLVLHLSLHAPTDIPLFSSLKWRTR